LNPAGFRFSNKIEGQNINIISIIDGRRNLEEILYKKIIDGKIK
jgi:toxin ParE1/3/4